MRYLCVSTLLLLSACGAPPGASSDFLDDDVFAVEAPLPETQAKDPKHRVSFYLVAFYNDVPDWVQPYVVRAVMKSRGLYIVHPPDQQFVERLKAHESVKFCEEERHYKTPLIQSKPLSSEQIQALKSQGGVSQKRHSSFQTQFVPNDSEYDFQWNMRAIRMEQAWDIRRNASDIIVAVIDSGVDPNHPDLQQNLLPLEDIWNEFSGSDRLLNRRTRELFDYAGRDGNGHGTHVAGVIGAVLSNAEGVAGIAGSSVKILPIKVTNLQGETSAALLVEAIQRAIDRGARVINLSIGSVGADQGLSRSLSLALEAALDEGITIVAASGNESERSRNIVTPVSLPAAFPGIVSVGAFLENNDVADYSNGGEDLDLLAPGGSGDLDSNGFPIVSTWPTYPTYEFLIGQVNTLSYAGISGTSMATPHVSAVAALLLAQEPDLTPQQVRSRLIATATDVGPVGFDEDSGYGFLNAQKALQATGDGPAL